MLSRFEFDMAGDEHMTDPVKEQLSACLDGELPAAELDLLLKRLERDPELRDVLGRYAADRRGPRADTKPVVASRSFAAKVMAAIDQEPAAVARRAVRLSPRWFAACVRWPESASRPAWRRWRSSQSSEPALHRAPSLRTSRLSRRRRSSHRTPTMPPATSCRPRTSQPAFVPATRLTNYVVAHSEYSSPLGRRSVLSGVLAEDDGDPDVATDGERQPQRRRTVPPVRRSRNEASMALLQILRRPGRRRAHGDEPAHAGGP